MFSRPDKMLCPVCSSFVERHAIEAKGGKNMEGKKMKLQVSAFRFFCHPSFCRLLPIPRVNAAARFFLFPYLHLTTNVRIAAKRL
ncbi:hypothetical protein, partial [Novipirellula sp.]|uniref:hypothetical protein n=1 Tax=Novipirellula sp. TaxID=2795430 RepID=UPI00356A2C08